MADSPPDDTMMSSFLDDYFAECDEHLNAIRRNILALEAALGMDRLDRAALDELFRSFHTIKGLSGMVGIREAERLAHQIESCLGAIRDRKVSLSATTMDTVIAGVNILEQVIGAKRENRSLPDTNALLAKLASLLPVESDTGKEIPQAAPTTLPPSANSSLDLKEQELELLQKARRQGASLWLYEFAPSHELAGRGLNVNIIRSRLESAGRLIHAAPRILPSGGIAFEFLVALPAPDQPPAAWREDGLSFHPYSAGGDDATPPPDRKEDLVHPEAQAPAQGRDKTTIAASSGIAPSNIVRIDLSRLDELMRLVGEMVISRSRLEEGLKRLEGETAPARLRPLQETNLALERQLRDLREAVMRIRLVPVGEIFNRMQFVVRDAARENQKKVALVLSGQDTEIDKLIVERMMDPLLHLVRNAVSHGLETSEEREAVGKPAEGRLTLRAATEGDLVVMEVEDDGSGLDMERITAQARKSGLLEAEERLDEQSLLDIICAPGFSTRFEADLTSGRGVGMTVVRDAILDLGGTLDISTTPGAGTRFTIRLPLTLAIADALIVASGDQVFAIPQSLIHEVIEIGMDTITVMENNELIPYRKGVLPLIHLRRLFHLDGQEKSVLYGLVIGAGLSAVAVAVDKIMGRREIVVRAMTDPLLQVPGVSGATELGDGRVVLILDASRFLQGKRQ